MNKETEIERLLTAYYEGNTTEEEEKALRQYFNVRKHIPETMKDDARWFRAIDKEQAISVPSNLEKSISDLIDKEARKNKTFFHLRTNNFRRRWIYGVAASIILLVGVGIGITRYTDRNEIPKDTYNNSKEAQKAASVILIDVSHTINSTLAEVN